MQNSRNDESEIAGIGEVQAIENDSSGLENDRESATIRRKMSIYISLFLLGLVLTLILLYIISKCDQDEILVDNRCLRKIVLWKHREKIYNYRQMTADELTMRLPEIGKFYEFRKGFSAYKEEIDIVECNYCSVDNNTVKFVRCR